MFWGKEKRNLRKRVKKQIRVKTRQDKERIKCKLYKWKKTFWKLPEINSSSESESEIKIKESKDENTKKKDFVILNCDGQYDPDITIERSKITSHYSVSLLLLKMKYFQIRT